MPSERTLAVVRVVARVDTLRLASIIAVAKVTLQLSTLEQLRSWRELDWGVCIDPAVRTEGFF